MEARRLAEAASDAHMTGMAPDELLRGPGVIEVAGRVAVRGLSLSEFRGYREVRLHIDERPVALRGPAGARRAGHHGVVDAADGPPLPRRGWPAAAVLRSPRLRFRSRACRALRRL